MGVKFYELFEDLQLRGGEIGLLVLRIGSEHEGRVLVQKVINDTNPAPLAPAGTLLSQLPQPTGSLDEITLVGLLKQAELELALILRRQ
jgi:hypothetical protein